MAGSDVPDRTDVEAARSAKSVLAGSLADVEGVNGVGIASEGGLYVLRVNVVSVETAPPLPAEVEGFPVSVRAVGPLSAR